MRKTPSRVSWARRAHERPPATPIIVSVEAARWTALRGVLSAAQREQAIERIGARMA